METDRRVLPFLDIRSEENLAHRLEVDHAFLVRVAERNESGEARVRTHRKMIRGKTREIQEPVDEELKQVLNSVVHCMALQTATMLRSSPLVHGYVPGRSAFTNAKAHVGSVFVQKLDIQNFFSTITSSMVIAAVQRLGMSQQAAILFARIVSRDNCLPLGYSPSPLISNLVVMPLDEDLALLASDHGVVITRYADDITLSAAEYFDLEAEVEALFNAHGFEINAAKSVTGKSAHGIHITGFTVARDSPRLPQHLKRVVRQDLFHIDRIGLDEQARVRGRTPESFARRMASRLGLLRSTEPEYYALLARGFPTAVSVLEDRRLASQERKRRRRERLANKLMAAPSSPPGFYEPSVSYREGTSDLASAANAVDSDSSSAWDLV